MPLSISVNLAHIPQGEIVSVAGLGRFENGGEAVEIDPDTELSFVQAHGKHVREAFEGQSGVSVSGTRTASDDDIEDATDPAESTDDDSEGKE